MYFLKEKDGEEYVLNGRKWWTTGACDPRVSLCIFMGKTDPQAQKHKQQSMVLVDMKTPGINVLRPLSVFGSKDSPVGHAEVDFNNVRVPVSNIVLGEGRGFEIGNTSSTLVIKRPISIGFYIEYQKLPSVSKFNHRLTTALLMLI